MKLTKKSISLIGIFLILTGASGTLFASGVPEKGSGQNTTEETKLSAANEISLNGINSFSIRKGDTASVEVSGDKAFVNKVNIEEKDDYLYISGNPNAAINVVITTPSLESLILTDHSQGSLSGNFDSKALSLSASSGSVLDVKSTVSAEEMLVYVAGLASITTSVDADHMLVKTKTGGSAVISGQAAELDAESSNGSANFIDMDIQKAVILAKSGAAFSAYFTGNSVVSVSLTGDSTLDLNMNGLLEAIVANDDSSLSCAGNIEWTGKYFI